LNYDVIVTLWKIDTILNIQSEVEAQTIGYKDTLGGAKVKECRTLKEAEVGWNAGCWLDKNLFRIIFKIFNGMVNSKAN